METDFNVHKKKKKKKSKKRDDLSGGEELHNLEGVITEDNVDLLTETDDLQAPGKRKNKKKKRNRQEDVSLNIPEKHKKHDRLVEGSPNSNTESCSESQHRKTKKRKHVGAADERTNDVVEKEDSSQVDADNPSDNPSSDKRAKKKHKKKKKKVQSEEEPQVEPSGTVADTGSDDQSMFITQSMSHVSEDDNPSPEEEQSRPAEGNLHPTKKKQKKKDPPLQEVIHRDSQRVRRKVVGRNSLMTGNDNQFLIDKLMDVVKKLELCTEPVALDFEPPPLHQSGRVHVLTRKEKEEFAASGIEITTKMWSKSEDAILQRNMMEFIERENIPHPALLLGYVPQARVQLKEFLEAKQFFIYLGKDLNTRPLHSIYKRARRIFCPYPEISSLTSDEVYEILNLQAKRGNKWAEFAKILNRPPDLLESTIRYRSTKTSSGPWSSEEEEALVKAVTKYSRRCGQSLTGDSSNLPWIKIAKKVATRNPSQCHQRWIFTMCFQSKLDNALTWKKKYSACIIYLLHHSDYKQEQDVDWEEISKKIDKKCNYSLIKRKWRLLKYTVPDHKNKDFEECLVYLYHKQLPTILKECKWSMEELTEACESP